MKILNSDWFTPPLVGTLYDALTGISSGLSIGIVAIETNQGKTWKAYIGYGITGDQEKDEQIIALNGAKISKELACATFPKLNPKTFVF